MFLEVIFELCDLGGVGEFGLEVPGFQSDAKERDYGVCVYLSVCEGQNVGVSHEIYVVRWGISGEREGGKV